jgi:hypothetical protein
VVIAATWTFNFFKMRSPKKQNPTQTLQLIPKASPLYKTCTCAACVPKKSKLPDGKRRLKISLKTIVHQRLWAGEEIQYNYVPQIRLVGEWLRKTGFESGQYVVISGENGKLMIEIDKE